MTIRTLEPPAVRPRPRAGVLRPLLPALVAGAVLISALVVARSEIFSDPAPVLGARDSRCWRYKTSERGFTRKINAARRRAGRSRLSLDPELSRVARAHTRTMVRRNLLHHSRQSTLGRRVTRWAYLGENIGVGASVRTLHSAFMHSAPHRHNIMGRYRHLGVGVLKKRGRMWVTVVFERTTDPGTRLRMPRC